MKETITFIAAWLLLVSISAAVIAFLWYVFEQQNPYSTFIAISIIVSAIVWLLTEMVRAEP
jgi:hypothetical protein